MTSIFYERFEVGQIDIGDDGLSFSYDSRWLNTENAFPVSLSLPLADTRYSTDKILPWLANLLPEDQNLVTIGRILGIAPQDTIGLLEQLGSDLAGALSIGVPRHSEKAGYRFIETEEALEKIINGLPAKPFLAGEDGVSMSLAGVQEKLPVAMIDDKMAIPVNGASSTHILKPDSKRLFGSVQNEALCLTLAQSCDIEAAAVTTGKAGDRTYLLVERYDRKYTDQGIKRVHQEDFCQALSKPPAAKYENNHTGIKGPSLTDFFDLARNQMTGLDTNKILNAVIFNILLCNTDSHAKNYSILLSHDVPRLAPLYDVMCGAPWDGITENLSQTVGGKNRGRHIHGRHWKRMASDCGLNENLVIERIEQLADKLLTNLPKAAEIVRAMPAGDHPMLDNFQNAIISRCNTVLDNLRD